MAPVRCSMAGDCSLTHLASLTVCECVCGRGGRVTPDNGEGADEAPRYFLPRLKALTAGGSLGINLCLLDFSRAQLHSQSTVHYILRTTPSPPPTLPLFPPNQRRASPRCPLAPASLPLPPAARAGLGKHGAQLLDLLLAALHLLRAGGQQGLHLCEGRGLAGARRLQRHHAG